MKSLPSNRILIIEDEHDVLDLLTLNLRKARAELPALIILDLMLPKMPGLEICKILKTDPATQHIAILMLTAKAEEIDRIVIVFEEAGGEVDDEEDLDVDDDESGHVLRIALSREQAAAFAIHATRLVEAGRPPCPLCGLPLDPSGHDCPRTNGHRPPVT